MNRPNASRPAAAAPPSPSGAALLSVIRERREAIARELSELRGQLTRTDLLDVERGHLERSEVVTTRVLAELDRITEAARALALAPTAHQGGLFGPGDRSPRPFARASRPCTSCAGTGKDGAAPCRRCWGTKVVR